jgi:transcriptional regulator with XRE-family HTH domain
MEKLYKQLGGAIKDLRLVSSESIDEVCEAVEMQPQDLKAIEAGTQRPDEEILALLLSHFEVQENEALRLWQLAGYDQADLEDDVSDDIGSSKNNDDKEKNNLRINVPNNSPVLYTDMVQVMTNQYGVVLHFLQLSPNQQATVVSRIGMSKSHAKSLMELLKRNLEADD